MLLFMASNCQKSKCDTHLNTFNFKPMSTYNNWELWLFCYAFIINTTNNCIALLVIERFKTVVPKKIISVQFNCIDLITKADDVAPYNALSRKNLVSFTTCFPIWPSCCSLVFSWTCLTSCILQSSQDSDREHNSYQSQYGISFIITTIKSFHETKAESKPQSDQGNI